jgi:anti-sigma-K factor RskA
MNRKVDEQLMLRYLLGDLPDEEKLHLEERFFTDKEFYEQLLAREDELICEYVQGELSTQESQQFERRFLSSPEDRERVETAKALMAKIAEAPVEAAPEPGKTHTASNSWWLSLIPFTSLGNPAMKLILAAVTLLLLFAGSWLVYKNLRMQAQIEQLIAKDAEQEAQVNEARERNQQLAEELEQERTRTALMTGEVERYSGKSSDPKTGKDSTITQETSVNQSDLPLLALMPGQIRSGSVIKKLRIPPGTKQLRIQLDVRSDQEYETYRATLETAEGREIFSLDRLKIVKTNSTRIISFPAGAKLFLPGDYMITLAGLAADKSYEEVGDYYFTILKK